MADKTLTPEERAFLEETGLQPNHLAPLVADAPALPADALERIRTRTRAKAGVTAESAPLATPALDSAKETPRGSAARRPRWWMAAAAAVLIYGGTLAITDPNGAMAAIQRLVRLVPGIGLTSTDSQTLVMRQPVSVESRGERLTITGLISDGEKTEIRYLVEGLPLDKQDSPEPDAPFKPVLRLADGTVLESTSAAGGGGTGTFGGTVWFKPLPSGTTDLTLSLPSAYGMTQPFEIAIPVVDAGAAGLAEAMSGNWSEEQLGIRVGVPYWTTQGDRIILNLEASLPKGTQVEQVGETNDGLHFEPVLTDKQGRVYPLIPEESNLWPNAGMHLSATFQGPIAADAGVLRLRVPVLRVSESAEAHLSIPLTRVPVGEPLQLDEQVNIGTRSFAVNTVTRVDAETFRFDLDLGPEANGRLLQEVLISPQRRLFGGNGGWSTGGRLNQETWQLEMLEYSPGVVPERNLDVVFSRPVVRLSGGWEVELPVTPAP